MHTDETGSATPITPDSVVGTDISMNGSFTERSSGDDKRIDVDSQPGELLQTILRQESLPHYQLSPDYLHSSVLIPSSAKEQGVSERCRRRTCEWMYDICDYFHLNRECVAIALFYVDRYFTLTSFPGGRCSEQVPVTRKQFQLVALTGLYIAIKTHGELRNQAKSTNPVQWSRGKFNIQICASISRHQFTPQAIERCEELMLRTLDWRVNPVVPSGVMIDTLLNYLTPGSINCVGNSTGVELYVYDCSKYLAELSCSVPALMMVYKPSVIAYASIIYALDVYGTKLFPPHRRAAFEDVMKQASDHFDTKEENIKSARGILQVICPNLSELFPPPTTDPTSPNSVKMSDSI